MSNQPQTTNGKNNGTLGLMVPYLVETPHPLLEAKTIQIVLLREILDYTILRTEETREVNTVITPLSINGGHNEQRAAFLGSKQKAVESRELERMLRTATRSAQISKPDCYLKDGLCLECPRCALFGATNVQSGAEKFGNIKHRIEYSTNFSLLPYKEIGEATTFNGISDVTQMTGQTLGTRYSVIPATLFPGIVTLRSVTQREFVLAIKTLLASKSYGAESRIGGDVRNTIVGLVAGWEEVITPLELTLEFYGRCVESKDEKQPQALDGNTTEGILKAYKEYAGNPDKVKVFTTDEVDKIVESVAQQPLDKTFLEAAYADVEAYRQVQREASKKK
jgi:CRISPR type I-D-associated protein Csc2